MTISEDVKSKIKLHALKNVQEECCGIIVEKFDKFDLQVIECKNIAETKKSFFAIDPKDYLRASAAGKVKAIYHSHITENENFSQSDKENSLKHKTDYILYNLKKDSFHHYGYKNNSTSEISKQFKWGDSDCIILVMDYLKSKGMKINGDFLKKGKYSTRDPHWPEKLPNLIEDVLSVYNKFRKVSVKDMKENDVLCFSIFKSKFTPKYDHWAVLVGENQIYHHPVNRYPTVEDLGRFYKAKLVDVYRYFEDE